MRGTLWKRCHRQRDGPTERSILRVAWSQLKMYDYSVLSVFFFLHFLVPFSGTYAICVDNTFSRFSSKLVYLYIITYVVADWQTFADEMKSFDGSVGNFTVGIGGIFCRSTPSEIIYVPFENCNLVLLLIGVFFFSLRPDCQTTQIWHINVRKKVAAILPNSGPSAHLSNEVRLHGVNHRHLKLYFLWLEILHLITLPLPHPHPSLSFVWYHMFRVTRIFDCNWILISQKCC